MLLQAADAGGQFEYVPKLRNPDDECYSQVKKILDGQRDRVERLTLKAGDLQLFHGRYSLHRVTRNTGKVDRMLLIMSFAEQAGMIGSSVRSKHLYGKITDAHLEHDRSRVRSDELHD